MRFIVVYPSCFVFARVFVVGFVVGFVFVAAQKVTGGKELRGGAVILVAFVFLVLTGGGRLVKVASVGLSLRSPAVVRNELCGFMGRTFCELGGSGSRSAGFFRTSGVAGSRSSVTR